ncbi:hypothetical protein PLCT1_02747 [Planctomycetaceae bacterium]|nr:hypothetical protein PLCT1_02747 [Planctomycetaceae bacterium]
MYAEQAYLFRHTLLCDVAYQLHLPGQRARLHALALELMESVLRVGPPAMRHDPSDDPPYRFDPCDVYASELARHARHATAELTGTKLARLQEAEVRYLARGAAYAYQTYHHEEAAQLWQRLAGHPAAPLARRCEALRHASMALDQIGRSAEARQLALRGVEIARGIEGEPGQRLLSRALGMLGVLLSHLGEVDQARALFEEALSVAQAVGDKRIEGAALRNLSTFLAGGGEMQRAIELARRCQAAVQQAGDLVTENIVLGNIATMLFEIGKMDESEPLMLESIRRLESAKDLRYLLQMRSNLGALLDQKGDLERARASYQDALDLARATGDRRAEGITLSNLSSMQENNGESEAALVGMRKALAITQEIGDRANEGLNYGNLGTCELSLGRYESAERHFTHGLGIARELHEGRLEGTWTCYLGCVCILTGRTGEGERQWNEGSAVLKAMEDPYILPVLTRQYEGYRKKMGLPPSAPAESTAP